MSNSDYSIREIQSEDYPAWSVLWKAYLEFYNTELPEQQYLETFSRLVSTEHLSSSSERYSPGEIYGLLLISPSGSPIGLAHYLFHSSAWTSSPLAQCYLNDLYVSPEHRGQNLAEKLIREVERSIRDVEGCGRLYWLTQPGNERARKVYDRVCAEDAKTGASEENIKGDNLPTLEEEESQKPKKKRTGGLMDRVVYKIDL